MLALRYLYNSKFLRVIRRQIHFKACMAGCKETHCTRSPSLWGHWYLAGSRPSFPAVGQQSAPSMAFAFPTANLPRGCEVSVPVWEPPAFLIAWGSTPWSPFIALVRFSFLSWGERVNNHFVWLFQVKKAYRQKALSCHPDKNPDNPRAGETLPGVGR